MKTVFQQNIKKEDLIAVTKMLHPDLSVSIIEQRIKYYSKYSWVVVEFHVKDYGNINFAINNHEQRTHTMFGSSTTKERVSRAIESGEIHFRIWRMSIDKLNDKDATSKEIIDRLPREQPVLDAQKYISNRYQLPTAEEFYNNYYSD